MAAPIVKSEYTISIQLLIFGDGSTQRWQHPEMAAPRDGNTQRWQHLEMATPIVKSEYTIYGNGPKLMETKLSFL